MKEEYLYSLVDKSVVLDTCTEESLDIAAQQFDVTVLEWYKGMAVCADNTTHFKYGITWEPVE